MISDWGDLPVFSCLLFYHLLRGSETSEPGGLGRWGLCAGTSGLG